MAARMNYIIFATPRTGSYLLCDALTATGLAGLPSELFGPGQAAAILHYQYQVPFADVLAWIIQKRTTFNGVFGVKIIWQYLEDFLDEVREIPGYERMPVTEVLATIFPNARYIWTTRRDKIRQAISYWKAMQTKQWIDIGLSVAKGSDGELHFDPRAIDVLLKGIIEDEVEIERFFAEHGITAFKVVYEDFVTAYEETVRGVLDFLEIRLPADFVFARPRLKRQANQHTEDWVQRFREWKGIAPAATVIRSSERIGG